MGLQCTTPWSRHALSHSGYRLSAAVWCLPDAAIREGLPACLYVLGKQALQMAELLADRHYRSPVLQHISLLRLDGILNGWVAPCSSRSLLGSGL